MAWGCKCDICNVWEFEFSEVYAGNSVWCSVVCGVVQCSLWKFGMFYNLTWEQRSNGSVTSIHAVQCSAVQCHTFHPKTP